jgi:integrase-like protein
VIEARKTHPFWGPKKLRSWLSEREPTLALPAASTIGTLLLRHGLIRPRRRRPREPLTGTALTQCDRPNAVWSVDFKGHFGLGDGTRCHPLTVSDGFSRYLLRCEALSEPREEPVRAQFERVFREFGLPARIRSDNGSPFATQSPAGLSALSVWWIKLGIVPERITATTQVRRGRAPEVPRHTFITIARREGARKDVLERITHNAHGDIVDQYTHWDWAPLCEAVSCFRCDAKCDASDSEAENKWRRRESNSEVWRYATRRRRCLFRSKCSIPIAFTPGSEVLSSSLESPRMHPVRGKDGARA